ncbi:MAG: acetate/propionate family kinase [Deltaproteobacteria bacterium]|nr:acetate/propionate family kinase [Deltaproteobacteria bacterium]
MGDLIVVLNAGSSSLKFTVYVDQGEKPGVLYDGQFEGILTEPRFKVKDSAGQVAAEKKWPPGKPLGHEGAVEALFAWGRDVLSSTDRIVAMGHRVVHGGLEYTRPTVVNAHILGDLERFVPLAPLHQPHNLAAIRIIAKRNPAIPQVACFDTSFHTTIPAVAQAFALPRKFTEQGVRRYGFHGLSYEYIASVLPGYDAKAAEGRTIVAHLGNGASLCAMKGLKSVACTLGFTAVEGLMMGTRCGALDPGVMLYLMDECGMDARAIEKLIYQESGLLGVSGISSDMRTLLTSPDPRAAEAVELFVYRITRELGSLAAALGGLDAIVFTAGIGENSAPIRKRVCRSAEWLGLQFDEKANEAGGPCISREGSRLKAWVIPTDEELMIALHTRQALSGKAG